MPTVGELMTRNPASVRTNENMFNAAATMQSRDLGALPIVDETTGKLRGMLTDRDIVTTVLAQRREPNGATAGDFVSETVVGVSPDEDAEQAFERMTENKVRRLPVIENGQLVGMVTVGDLAANLPQATVGQLTQYIQATA